jgi:hypothetical protein
MKSIRQMLVVVLVATTFTSCRKVHDELAPSVVHGQVFVVLKPGNALKLALASVSVIPEQDALAAAEAAKKQCEATLGIAQSDISQELSSIANQLAVRRAGLRKEQEQLAAEVEAMRERRDFSEAYSSKVAAIGAIEDELNSAETVSGKEELVRQNRENAVRRYPVEFAEALIRVAKPASVTRTNADGEFTLELSKRRGRVAILIEASRELETVERFVWFVWLDQLTTDGGVYLFSNHNVLSADNNSSVVNVAAALPET